MKNVTFVLLVLTSVFVLFDTIIQISNGKFVGLSLETVAFKVILGIPKSVYELMPLSSLTGSLLTISKLAVNSEYAVMRVSGLSLPGLMRVLSVVGIVLIASTIVIGEVVKPKATDALNKLSLHQEAGDLIVQTFRTGAWFKDHDRIINVRHISSDYGTGGVTIYEMNPKSRTINRIIAAKSARISPTGAWLLSEVSTTLLTPGGITRHSQANVEIRTAITPSVVELVSADQDSLSFIELRRHIEHLNTNGEDSYAYRSSQWKKIGHLAIIFVLVLISPHFIGLNSRGRQVSFWVFNGILGGVGIYFVTQVIEAIGALNRLPPISYSLLPPVFILAFAYLSSHFRDN